MIAKLQRSFRPIWYANKGFKIEILAIIPFGFKRRFYWEKSI